MLATQNRTSQTGGFLDSLRSAGRNILTAGGEAIGTGLKAYGQVFAEQLRASASRQAQRLFGDGGAGDVSEPAPQQAASVGQEGMIFGVKRETALLVGGSALAIVALVILTRK